jgi:integrase
MATLTKLPSGRWRAQVRRRGFYRAETFDKKAQARAWATEIESQISASQGLIRPKGAKLSDLIERYRESVPGGGRTKRACLDRLNERLGHLPLERLGALHLRDYIDKRQAEGAGGVTIAQDLSYLATVLSWARLVRRIDVAPELARDARRGLKHRELETRSRERSRTPSTEELERLRTYWEAKPRQMIPMPDLVDFAIASAMRLGEICRITAEDVDRTERTVIIRDRKDPKRKKGNDQVVPLLTEAMAMVEERLRAHPRGRLFPYNAASVSTAFTRACTALGVLDLHFHDLRHLGTVLLFRRGLDIPRVALITGHKDWGNLRRYTNLTAADVHGAVR